MENTFCYRFTQGSLDSNSKLIRTIEQLGIAKESIFQIYDQNGTLYDPSVGWNDGEITINWNSNILTIDFSPISPISGEWQLKFDRSCTDTDKTSGYSPRETNVSIDAKPNDLIICLSGGITVNLPSASNGDMIKISTQNISGDVTISPFNGDTIINELSFIIGFSYSSSEFVYNASLRTWRVVTPQIAKVSNSISSGYHPIEISENYTANANDLVICDSANLNITLPSGQENGTMIKISTQDSGGAKIVTDGDQKIGGSYTYFLNQNSSVEFVFNESKNKWLVISSSGSSSANNSGSSEESSTYDDKNSCMAHNTNIKTREQFKDWIYRKLGWPLVSIELTDEMLDDCINDSILELSEYAYQNRKFYAFNLQNYVEGVGIELPLGVTIVTRVSSNLVGPNAVGAGKIDNYMNDLVANGAIGFPMLGRPAGSGWVNYEMAMEYLDFSQKMLGGDYDTVYDPRSRILELYPDPVKAQQRSGWIVVECQCMRKDDQQFGDNWVKRMALAQAKIVLGRVRSKFTNVSLPGGGQINSDDKQEGINERDALIVELHERFPLTNVYMM